MFQFEMQSELAREYTTRKEIGMATVMEMAMIMAKAHLVPPFLGLVVLVASALALALAAMLVALALVRMVRRR